MDRMALLEQRIREIEGSATLQVSRHPDAIVDYLDNRKKLTPVLREAFQGYPEEKELIQTLHQYELTPAKIRKSVAESLLYGLTREEYPRGLRTLCEVLNNPTVHATILAIPTYHQLLAMETIQDIALQANNAEIIPTILETITKTKGKKRKSLLDCFSGMSESVSGAASYQSVFDRLHSQSSIRYGAYENALSFTARCEKPEIVHDVANLLDTLPKKDLQKAADRVMLIISQEGNPDALYTMLSEQYNFSPNEDSRREGIITAILYHHDPIHLRRLSEYPQEYHSEAEIITPKLQNCASVEEVHSLLYDTFVDMFEYGGALNEKTSSHIAPGDAGPKELYKPIAEDIFKTVS